MHRAAWFPLLLLATLASSCAKPAPDESQTVDVPATVRLANGLEIRVRIDASSDSTLAPRATFNVTNTGKQQRWFYLGNSPTLVDDRGKIYACTSPDEHVLTELGMPAGAGSARGPGGAGMQGRYGARMQAMDELAFEAPAPGWKYLILRVSAARFGSRGLLQFKLTQANSRRTSGE